MYRLISILVVLGPSLVSLSGARQGLSIPQICKEMRKGEDMQGSFSGDGIVTLSYVGDTPSEPPARAIEDDRMEGKYRWYVAGRHWWMVKRKDLTNPDDDMGVVINVVRDHADQSLRYTEYWDRAGKLNFANGHLDAKQSQAQLGPQAGRRWSDGPIAEMLRSMDDVRQSNSADGIEIDGVYKGMPLHLTVAPQYRYLTTKLLLHPGKGRFGFTITKVRRIGSAYLPQRIELVNGDYAGGRLEKGFVGLVELSNTSLHEVPTRQEVGAPAPGAIIGSDQNRLYRFAADGTLVEFGRQGSAPGTSLAYGDLFVLSGAGLLLTSLSWLVFRKRRSLPSSSRR